MVDAALSPSSLTELVEEWQQRTPGSLAGWASFEGLPSYHRERCTRAWDVSGDPYAMLLFLALICPYEARSTCTALASRMVFLPALARLSIEQEEWATGRRFNGPSTFRFSVLAQRARSGLRELPETQRTEVARELSDAVREIVPDPYVFYEVYSPTLAASLDRDRDRDRPLLSCNVQVVPRCESPRQRRIRMVSWNDRHGCWTYTLDDDTSLLPRRFAAEELELAD